MKKGFTLIELLLVVLVVSLLAVTVFVALNPSKRVQDAKNARRWSDVTNILSAIHSSVVDNKGNLPTNLVSLGVGVEAQLGTGDAAACSPVGSPCQVLAGRACVNLMTGTQNLTKYLAGLPIDPTGSPTYGGANTGYSVSVDTNGIVVIKACGAEAGSQIQVAR